MKKLLTLLLVLAITTTNAQKGVSEVNKIQGFYVFVDSQPIAEYEVLGQVNVDAKDPDIKKSKGQYTSVRDNLIKTARQANLTADGVILKFMNGGTDKAEIIKFKDGQKDKNKAKVEQYQGLYVFVDSKPYLETEYLGTVDKKISFSGNQYSTLRDALIKKSKNEFKDADALIIKFVEGGSDNGDAVKLK